VSFVVFELLSVVLAGGCVDDVVVLEVVEELVEEFEGTVFVVGTLFELGAAGNVDIVLGVEVDVVVELGAGVIVVFSLAVVDGFFSVEISSSLSESVDVFSVSLSAVSSVVFSGVATKGLTVEGAGLAESDKLFDDVLSLLLSTAIVLELFVDVLFVVDVFVEAEFVCGSEEIKGFVVEGVGATENDKLLDDETLLLSIAIVSEDG